MGGGCKLPPDVSLAFCHRTSLRPRAENCMVKSRSAWRRWGRSRTRQRWPASQGPPASRFFTRPSLSPATALTTPTATWVSSQDAMGIGCSSAGNAPDLCVFTLPPHLHLECHTDNPCSCHNLFMIDTLRCCYRSWNAEICEALSPKEGDVVVEGKKGPSAFPNTKCGRCSDAPSHPLSMPHIQSHPIPSHPILSHPIPSHPISSHPIRSDPTRSDPIQPHPTPTEPHPTPPRPMTPQPTDPTQPDGELTGTRHRDNCTRGLHGQLLRGEHSQVTPHSTLPHPTPRHLILLRIASLHQTSP